MKNSKFLLLSISLLFSSLLYSQSRGELISDTLMASFDRVSLEDLYGQFDVPEVLFPIDYDSIEVHKLVYWTIDARGNDLIEASGLITIPVGSSCDFPLMNFNHGTLTYDEVLSDLQAGSMQHFVGVPFAANGYVSILPDYLGYGATPVTHPHGYIHAKSEATSVVDMLRASREFCDLFNIRLNGQLFVLGYSHGGHVAMATHRELEEFHSDEFTVTASSPCSGAYDVSGIMRDSMIYSDFYSNPFYIAFTTVSYQFVYEDLYKDISDVFVAPYDSIIPLMLDRSDPQSFWRDSLPTPGYLMLQPDFLDSITTNTNHPFNLALRDNDVYDWIPQAPVRMYYCEADERVPYNNAIFTRDHMLGLGATDITALSAGASNDHGGCTFPAVIGAKLWFDTFKNGCSTTSVIAVAEPDRLNIYPNPFTETLHFDASDTQATHLNVSFYDMMGRQVHTAQLAGSGTLYFPSEKLPAGNYLVRVIADDRSSSRILMKAR